MSAAAAQVGVVVIGATGRMGRGLVSQLATHPALRLHAALGSPASRFLGRDSGEIAGMPPSGVPVTSDIPAALIGAGLALDFSTPADLAVHVQHCAAARVPLLLGATGYGPEVTVALEAAAKRIPVLLAPNASLGATVLQELARRAAAVLGRGYEVSIRDLHHAAKRDAPSGTALALAAAVEEGSGHSRQVRHISDRVGEVVGEHEVCFQGDGESLRLGHYATDRGIFARGALRAGLWLARQPPGCYQMADTIDEK